MAQVGGLQLVDVRGPGELAAGKIAGALEVPLPRILDQLAELDPAAPTVVYCAGGYRSMIAASVMRAAGFDDVSDVVGGFAAWEQAGLPVEDPVRSPIEQTAGPPPDHPAGLPA
jgi:rhodanese-related sulfurtransferase